MSGHERQVRGQKVDGMFYNATTRRYEAERPEGRKAGSKVPPAKRKSARRGKK